MKTKLRIKILEKLSQANPETKLISGSPTNVDINSFPNKIIFAWGNNNHTAIQKLIDLLNDTLFYLTSGQIDFYKMKNSGFITDISQYHSELKFIILLSKIIYNNILSNLGQAFENKLTSEEKKEIIDKIKSDVSLDSIPNSGINSILQNKIGGNFKSLILNILSSIK